ncbi:hypothetical protein [Phenylobacterium deserti]|uniref:Nucleotide-diphospho-sugar transferase domain-containing protein n=1 Tax=Phenylobacterium deserti TaxID=1914756 RepID=A0A328ADU5_9CAUL|nr:hypothetical protein [Phenylobacterium deserti]RAK52819.1 hypothetical protein DJ018_11590 [Phenylobacterium deserti]
MKIAILQFDNRPIDKLGLMPLLVQRNAAYAARQGYEHHFVTAAPFDLPVYWQKPAMCRHVLRSGYDAVLWLDTDAVVHDLDRRIEDLFQGDELMVGAPDNPHWPQPFNAGVFAARGEGGAQLMGRWAELFEGTNWERTATAWVCHGEWAGADFEQGAFNGRLLETLKAAGELRIADWRVLQSPFPVEGAFTLHFAGPFRSNLPVYLALDGASPAAG